MIPKGIGRMAAAAVGTGLVSSLAACLFVGAGAGAGGGIYFTSRGVESVVAAPVAEVAAATERAFEHFSLERTEYRVERDGARQEFRGKPAEGEPEVTVTLRREAEGSTKVEVTARTGLVTWDKEYARGVIEKIVEFAGS